MPKAVVAPIPRATQRTIEGTKNNPYFPGKKEMRIRYTYTRRTGYCPKAEPEEGHKNKASSMFIGMNEHGWIFRCTYDLGCPHFFVNKPPEGT